MPLTGLVLFVLGGVYAFNYARSSEQAKREDMNTRVARYGRILFPAAGVILILLWVIGELF